MSITLQRYEIELRFENYTPRNSSGRPERDKKTAFRTRNPVRRAHAAHARSDSDSLNRPTRSTGRSRLCRRALPTCHPFAPTAAAHDLPGAACAMIVSVRARMIDPLT